MLIVVVPLVLIDDQRARSDETHLAAQDVDQLRQLIQTRGAQQSFPFWAVKNVGISKQMFNRGCGL
jgi:hypothetical protein